MPNQTNEPTRKMYFVNEDGENVETNNRFALYRNRVYDIYLEAISYPDFDGFYDLEMEDIFYCTVSGNLFLEPYITPAGHTYERVIIEKLINEIEDGRPRHKDPITLNHLTIQELRPNNVIKRLLDNLIANDPALQAEERGADKFIW